MRVYRYLERQLLDTGGWVGQAEGELLKAVDNGWIVGGCMFAAGVWSLGVSQNPCTVPAIAQYLPPAVAARSSRACSPGRLLPPQATS